MNGDQVLKSKMPSRGKSLLINSIEANKEMKSVLDIYRLVPSYPFPLGP